MPKIVRFHETGGAEVLKLEDLPLTEPGEGKVRLKVQAIGLNRADDLFRQGQYLQNPELPSRLAYEAAGTVAAVGLGVSGVHKGDRVSTIPAFGMGEYGVYGESAIVPVDAVGCRLLPKPAHIWRTCPSSRFSDAVHQGRPTAMPHTHVRPPSTKIVCPVMNTPAWEPSSKAVPTMSPGLPNLPMGIWLSA